MYEEFLKTFESTTEMKRVQNNIKLYVCVGLQMSA